jgi:hypothetical protein
MLIDYWDVLVEVEGLASKMIDCSLDLLSPL